MENGNGHISEKNGAPTSGEKQLLNGKGKTRQVVLPPATTASQGCWRNIYVFVANIVLLNIARMTMKVYFGGTIRTIERRFGFSSTNTGIFHGVNDIAHICLVLFFGYFGRSVHKPRVIAVTLLFPALAGFLFALPYFILKSGSDSAMRETNASTSHNASSFFGPRMRPIQMCDGNMLEDCNRSVESSLSDDRMVAYVIFLLASVITGVGGPAIMTLGFPYIDENSARSKVPLLIAANYSPEDPRFIGAWWLGFLIAATVIVVLCIPLFFYPKHMTPRALALSQVNETKEHSKEEESLFEKLKGFPSALLQLLQNRIYLMYLAVSLCGIYVLQGVFIQSPRYLESHFLLPAFKANIIAACASGGTGLVGVLAGGVLINRLRLQTTGMAKLMVICDLALLVGVGIMMFFWCPKVELAGESDPINDELSIDMACNQNCSCVANKKTYSPVCGADQLTYFSPCHAGCSQSANGSYSDCGCIEERTAESGLCLDTCSLLVPFAVTLGITSLLSAIDKPAGTVVIMRIVPETDRTLALGLNSFCMNLLGFIPAPILFGHLIDTSCILWQKICGKTGGCLLYDPDKFRWRTYGFSFFVTVTNFVLVCIIWYMIKRNAHRFNKGFLSSKSPKDKSETTTEKKELSTNVTSL